MSWLEWIKVTTLYDLPSQHRSRPSSRNSLSEEARVHKNSRLNLYPHTPRKECAGIRDLDERVEVQLAEQLRDASVTSGTGSDAADAAERHTNLRGDVRLCDDIAEVEDPSAHGVDFRIGQFTHFTHDFPPYPETFAGISATLR
jgi:hypothetical protein